METPVTTSERIYRELRGMVFTGELQPGDKLVQRKLAVQLGVSAIPILEATRRLERDGLVVSHPNWGAQVQVWTEEDIEGAYLAREALEGISCRLFVERASTVDRAVLADLGKQFERAVMRRDAKAWLDADLALHNHIVHATRASTLIHIIESSLLTTLTMRNSQRRLQNDPESSYPAPDVHGVLIAVLLGSDADAAEMAGRDHIRQAYLKLQSLARA